MSKQPYLRGIDLRKQYTETHEIIPVFKRLLAENEQITCHCNNPVSKEIVFLEGISKESGERQNLFLGSNCAREILQFADKPQPPLFTLFKSDTQKGDSEKTDTTRESGEKNILNFCPLNEEMYNAIGILCEAWNIAFPKGDLLQILLYITKNPDIPTQDWAVTKFNGMVGKDGEGRKLVNMLQDLRQGGRELKYFTFHNMNAVINADAYKNNIE